jgi:hypothetical protein
MVSSAERRRVPCSLATTRQNSSVPASLFVFWLQTTFSLPFWHVCALHKRAAPSVCTGQAKQLSNPGMESILKASYGDRKQQEANRKPVDQRAAAKLLAQFKAQKAAQGPREVLQACLVWRSKATTAL